MTTDNRNRTRKTSHSKHVDRLRDHPAFWLVFTALYAVVFIRLFKILMG
ncbi:hypothetical protein [Galactobacillus timonensis]|nr:hypothetical protein [Galactobacillus timonensis]